MGKTIRSLLFGSFLGICSVGVSHGAGVTIITHGFQFDEIDHGHNWVEAMGDYIAYRAGSTPYVYRMVITSAGTQLTATLTPQNSGLPPIEQSDDAEIVIKLYWDQAAGFSPPADTTSIARIATQSLQTLSHSCELPIQIIGHSRGASVASEMARFLGQQGIWVHQLTMLDPHPSSTFTDAPVNIWDTVLFADNYYENYPYTFPAGEKIDGASNEDLTDRLPGGYGEDPGPLYSYNNHSDVHLWYHGTVNVNFAASDGEQTFTGAMRTSPWYNSSEFGGQFAGFYNSRLGGGAYALDSFFNGYNDGGHNWFPDTRSTVTRSASEWPSLITLINNASEAVQSGNSFPIHCIIQSFDSGASVSAYLDNNQNPYNGNEIALTLPAINPQPSTGATTKVIDVNATVPLSTPSGYYSVYAKVTNPNGTRYLYAGAKVQVLAAAAPVAPTITSVSPTALLTSSSAQTFQIFGSGFTANSTLLFNGSVASTPARLHFQNQNEIDYDLIVQSAGNWTVQVINGAQTSNTKGFTVNNPSPTTGSLVVNLSPAGAVSAGAQWEVDGTGYNNSGQAVGYLTPGSHNVTFKPVSGYTAPATLPVTIVAGQQTTTQASYTTSTPNTYSLTLNYTSAQGQIAAWPPGSGGTYVADATVQLTASAASGYHFVSWSGDATGSANPTTVTMSGNKTVTATFASGDPTQGTMTITIQPPEAVAAGVKWGLSANDYRDSGSSYTTFPASYVVYLHPVDGWIGPASMLATVTAGTTANYTATFTADATPGLLSVALSPPDAVTAGAKWHVNNGPAQGDGSTVSLAPGNNYTVTFDSISGWTAPAPQTVAVQRSQTTVVTGTYSPPAGVPVIGSISPAVGTQSGGTLLTINGVNFTPQATVSIGGNLATGVSVPSSSQITCIAPASSTYGSVPVVVQTSGGTATSPNGFAYGFPQGTGFDVMNAFGGRAYGVAMQGNFAYVGEGRNLVVMNITTPANPSKAGRVQLPGIVQSVALFGQYAYVADGEAGLQIVDISTPASPTVRGFYSTGGFACGVAISGGRAYVAGDSGLDILDLTNPLQPTRVSSTNCGNCSDVVLKVSASGAFAYVSTYGQIFTVDVSNPNSPSIRSTNSLNGTTSLAISGSKLFGASYSDGLHMFDLTAPDSPVDLGAAPGMGNAFGVAVANGLVYAISVNDFMGFYVYQVNGTSLSTVGHVTGVSSSGWHLAVAGNTACVAGGTSGFEVINVSNPAAPTVSAQFTDSGLTGFYGSIASFSHYVCAAGEGGFRLVDVANPAAPSVTWLNTTLAMSTVRGRIIIANNCAFLADGNVKIVNLANPASPQLLANSISQNTIYAFDAAVVGNTLVVVGMDTSNVGKLMTFDISTPGSPVQRGAISIQPQSGYDPVTCVAVSGNEAIVGMNSGAIKVVDLSNVNAPIERGQVLTGVPYAFGIAMSADGHYAFETDGNQNSPLRIVDISNVTSPSLVTSIQLDATPGRKVEMLGTDLYVCTAKGLRVFDTTSPTTPTVKRMLTASGTTAVALPGLAAPIDQVYVADADGGIIALKEDDLESPDIFITNPTFSTAYTNSSSTISLGGVTDDNISVAKVVWSNDRGGGGEIGAPLDNWFVTGIKLLPGTNVLTVTAFDGAGNSSMDSVAVIYPITDQSQTITFPTIADQVFGDSPFPIAASASSGLPVTFNIVSGPATISSNVVTLTGAGIVEIAANQSGNSTYNAAVSVTNSLNVAKADQSIVFGGLADKYLNDLPFPITATASSGLSVSFSVLSGPANLSSNTLTITGAGTVTIRASQNGDANYNAALNVDRSFVVLKLPQFITFGALGRQVLGSAPFPLLGTASSSLPVNFNVLSGPAIVNGNILTITGAGLVVLRASQSGDATYAPAPNVDQALVITPGNNLITDSKYLQNGAFTFRFYGDDGTNYVVESSTDLVHWQRLITNQVNSLGFLEFTDADSTNYSKRFYQALPLP